MEPEGKLLWFLSKAIWTPSISSHHIFLDILYYHHHHSPMHALLPQLVSFLQVCLNVNNYFSFRSHCVFYFATRCQYSHRTIILVWISQSIAARENGTECDFFPQGFIVEFHSQISLYFDSYQRTRWVIARASYLQREYEEKDIE